MRERDSVRYETSKKVKRLKTKTGKDLVKQRGTIKYETRNRVRDRKKSGQI